MNDALVGAPADFVNIVRAMLISKTSTDAVAQAEHYRYDRATRILKAVVAGGSLQDPAWAGALVDYQVAVNGFVESLRSVSAFDSLLPAMVRIPMRTRAAFTVIAATGTVVDELTYKPVSKLSLAATDLVPRKSVVIFVMTNELAAAIASGGDAFLVREMRGGIGAGTDLEFLPELAAGVTEIASSGSTAADVYADVAALLAAVPVGQNSRLFLVMAPATAGQLSVKTTPDGAPAFPGMTPLGGEISGIPVLTSDALTTTSAGSSMLLVDASGVAADTATITLARSTVATLQSNTAPSSDASAVWQSLWQQNMTALKAERYFAFKRLRDDAVAEVRSVDYSNVS